MLFAAKRAYVGLDLGYHTIKAVQVERSASGWRITKSASTPTPPESMKDGVVVDVESVAVAIRDMIRENHMHANAAHIAVAGGSVVVRMVRIPQMSEATLRKSIKFEASRYVPSNVQDSHIEFEIVGPVDENQMDVMVVAAPKDVVESRVRACELAGLDVESVDVEPFAMYRSLIEAGEAPEWSESVIGLVDIGAASTNLSVVNRGAFVMTRSIPNGGDTLTEALKSYFKLSDENAEEGKRQLDIGELVDETTPRENPPLRVLQPHLDDLIREIRRSLNYYQSQQGENAESKKVTRLIITGGGAKLKGLARYVGHKLGMPVESADVLAGASFTTSESHTESGLDLAVASGLAMRSFAKAA